MRRRAPLGGPSPRRRAVGWAVVVLCVLALLVSAGAGGTPSRAGGRVTLLQAPPNPLAVRSTPVAGPAPTAAGSLDWVNLTLPNASAPEPLGSSGLVYDPADAEYVLFGGCGVVYCPANETWTFAHGRWSNVTEPASAPPARWSASMAYDPDAGGVLLFGGFSGNAALNDTWLYRAGVWTNLSSLGSAPPPRYDASLAFDPEAEENGSVVYGGFSANGSLLADTWVFHLGTGWVPLANATGAPTARAYASLVYDPGPKALILFGGLEACTGYCDASDLWEFYAGTWWPTNPAGAPSGRSGAAMTYDSALGKVVMYGGYNQSLGPLGDTWTWGSGGWAALTTTHSPPARYDAAFPPDSTGGSPVLFSGFGLTAFGNDTWALVAVPTVSLPSPPPAVEVGAPLELTVTVSGGTAPFDAWVEFGDGGIGVAHGDGPALTVPFVYDHSGIFAVNVTVTDALGMVATTLGSLTVAPRPSYVPSITPQALDIGSPAAFNSTARVAGAPPVSLSWSFGDGATAQGSEATHAYAASGTYTVWLNATDALGAVSGASVPLVVNPAVQATITTVSSTLYAGSPVALAAQPSGGTGPFQYDWSFGDGLSGHGAGPQHVYAQPGSYPVQLWVNDSGGGRVHATTTVTVTAPPGGSPIPGGTPSTPAAPWWLWAGVAIGLATAAGGGLLIWRSRRRG